MPKGKQPEQIHPEIFHLNNAERNTRVFAMKPKKGKCVSSQITEKLMSGELKVDYAMRDKGNRIAAISTLGKKPDGSFYQEDRFCIDQMPGLVNRELLKGPKQKNLFIKNVLQETVKALQEECGQEQKIGSTGLIAVQYENQVVAANVGDCSLYHCHVDDNKKLTLTRLNQWHNPTLPSESKRLKKLGVQIQKGGRLLPNGINLSRTIGDRATENFGLIHEPEFHTYELKPNGKNFIILASDGLTDYITIDTTIMTLYEETEEYTLTNDEGTSKPKNSIYRGEKALNIALQWFIEQTPDYDEYAIAEFLIAVTELGRVIPVAPYNRPLPCYDNNTVIVKKIDTKDKCPSVMAVFDGHGGSKVAEDCRKSCLSTMKKFIPQCLANLSSTPETSLPSTLSLSDTADAVSLSPLTNAEELLCPEDPLTAESSASDSYATEPMKKILETSKAQSSRELRKRRNSEDGNPKRPKQLRRTVSFNFRKTNDESITTQRSCGK